MPGYTFATDDERTISLVRTYAARLDISHLSCRVTTSRSQYKAWLGRAVPASYGGAYAYDKRHDRHLVLINLERIDLARPRAIEIVVCEELVHLRDRLDGDLRRHAKHGYDRIAHRVAALVGVSLDDVRHCLLPVARRPYRYVFRCDDCGWSVLRKRRGWWACPRCWRVRGQPVPLQPRPLETPQSDA
ncbi:MAG: hypothetical protein ACR2LS_11105 [Thermomicrobiales bacterium]